jgi:RHS repeat-associated protein
MDYFDNHMILIFSPYPAAQSVRFNRGEAGTISLNSFVLPLDLETGVRLDLNGDDEYQFATRPWFLRIARSAIQHPQKIIVDATPSTNLTSFHIENPIAAFGREAGGMKLYTGQAYTFGIYAGVYDENVSETNLIKISAYSRSGRSFSGNGTNISPSTTWTIPLPRRFGANSSWGTYASNGFSILVTNSSLITKAEIVDATIPFGPPAIWGLTWLGGSAVANSTLAGYRLTHTATDTNYYYKIEALGRAQIGANWLVNFATNSSGQWTPIPLYTLDFDAALPTRAQFLDNPYFRGIPLPPEYAGRSAAELGGLIAAATNDFSTALANSAYTNLDSSPELVRHPVLTQFVNDMGRDPLVLASYVVNEIALCDPLSCDVSDRAINGAVSSPGVKRSALGVYLEKRGSPTEQCALLIALLREAGYQAGYVFPTNNLRLLDDRFSQLFRIQLKSVVDVNGMPVVANALVLTDYPWVAAKIGTNCVHIFPWLKDTEVSEGASVYDYMPPAYDTAYKWAKAYALGDTNILNLAPDANTPSVLWPKFIEAALKTNTIDPRMTIDRLGMHASDRRHVFPTWDSFPKPNYLTNQASLTLVPALNATNSFLSNTFEAIRVDVNNGGTTLLTTGDFLAADLNDRKLLLYSNGPTTLTLWLAPRTPSATNTTGTFASNWSTNAQQVVATIPSGVTNLTIKVTYKRRSSATGGFSSYIPEVENPTVAENYRYNVADISAICWTFGRVTSEMVRFHAEDYWRLQRTRTLNTSFTPSLQDNQGTAAMVLGMSYWERLSRFAEFDQSMHKVTGLSSFGAGTATLVKAPSSARVQGKIDMIDGIAAIVGNASSRQESGDHWGTIFQPYYTMWIVAGSAEEHMVLKSSFQDEDAVSTVRLLQLASQRAGTSFAAPLELNSRDYATKGASAYTGYGSTHLQDQDTAVWAAAVSSTFVQADADYARVLITPGKIANSTGSYKGMGALTFEPTYFGAIIGGNSGVLNGGYSSTLPSFSVPSTPTYDLSYDLVSRDDDSFGFVYNDFSGPVYKSSFSDYDALTLTDTAGVDSIVFTPFQSEEAQLIESTFSGISSDAAAIKQAEDSGWEAAMSWMRNATEAVYDPVSSISGAFYVDTVDLSLPGPFPIELRRNYVSQNFADGEFGYGWKINFLPYLVQVPSSNLIQAAEPDGSVIVYRSLTNNVWIVQPQDNPTLNNNAKYGIGGTANVFNNLISKSTNGTTYTLFAADGSKRTFEQMSTFGITDGTNHLDRVRPYLVKVEDHAGNFQRFYYGTNSTANDFGYLNRIESGNGNFLGFSYDYFGRIIDAFSGDGRRVRYEFDDYGDLVRVQLPDASQWKYEYQHISLGTNSDLALGKTATQSSTLVDTPSPTASESVDGNTDGNYFDRSVSHTGSDAQAWWQVDLGASYDIGNILVWNRTDCCGSRLSDYYVFVSDNAFTSTSLSTTLSQSGVSSYHQTTTAGSPTSVSVHRTGRYVRVQLTGTGYLALAEVQVMAPPTYSTHLLTRELKPDGRTLQNAYDNLRRVITQAATVGIDRVLITNAFFYYTNNAVSISDNALSGATRIDDAFHNPTVYYYTSNLITQVVDPLSRTFVQDWFDPSETNKTGYYPRSLESVTDKRGLVTKYFYDSRGNATNITMTGDLLGVGFTNDVAVIATAFSTSNVPLSVTDPVGNGVSYFYDNSTDPFLVTRMAKFAGTNLLSTNTFSYTNISEVISVGGGTRTNQVFALRNQEVQAAVATNQWTFDSRGFPLSSIRYARTAEDTSNPDPAVTLLFSFNQRGQLFEETDAVGRKTRADFDAMGRPLWREVIDENGVAVSRETFYYNENGELEWYDGPRSNPDDFVHYDYDGMGHKSEETHWRARAKADGSGVEENPGDDKFATTFFRYDAFGNFVGQVDPRGVVTTNFYDAAGELTLTKTLAPDGSLLSSTQFNYEPGGLVHYETNALGGVTETKYTSRGQPYYRKSPSGAVKQVAYDLAGRTLREFVGAGVDSWTTTYDDAHLRVSKVFNNFHTPVLTNITEFDKRGNAVRRFDAAGNGFTNTFDGLGRLKFSLGPITLFVAQPGDPSPPPSPPPAQQLAYITYDAAGIWTITTNALGDKTKVKRDAIGREVLTEVRDSTDALVRSTATSYSTDGHIITVTEGVSPAALTRYSYVDNDGRTVGDVAFSWSTLMEYTLTTRDVAGNPTNILRSSNNRGFVSLWRIETNSFDGLNRIVARSDHDNAITTFAYDALGDLTNRVNPGGLIWRATYNNAGQTIANWNAESGGSTIRSNYFTYYPATNAFGGLLQTATDARGVTCTHIYDNLLRPLTNTYAGSGVLPEQNQTTSYAYDIRGLVTNIVEKFADPATGPDTTLQRHYSAYGVLETETVLIGTNLHSASHLARDSAGRRSSLGVNGFGWWYGWRSDDLLASVSLPGPGTAYSYNAAGLLTGRAAESLSMNVAGFDGVGRPLGRTTTIGGATNLVESLSYTEDGLLSGHTVVRDYTDARTYGYAPLSRRLTAENLKVNATTNWAGQFQYDNGAASKSGVLTSISDANSGSAWSSGPDVFNRVTQETNNVVQRLSNGRVNAVNQYAAVDVRLDGNPFSVSTVGTTTMNWPVQWWASLELLPGSHTLQAEAKHASGLFTTSQTITFTNNAVDLATLNYFSEGQLTQRVWRTTLSGTNRTQTFAWDGKGRLFKMSERDNNTNGFDWVSVYDVQGRRLQTTTTRVINGVAQTAQPVVTKSYFDPGVEFLELGVNVNGVTTWKVYGPDLQGGYGGMNGTGGLDMMIQDPGTIYLTVSDARGNVQGQFDYTHTIATAWNASRPNGYGAIPEYRPLSIDQPPNIGAAVAWRGRWPDPSGLYWLGARYFDPVAGRFLSCDPLGHDADPALYSFCDGDPINRFDGDGRFGKAITGDGGASRFGVEPQSLFSANGAN